MRSIEDNYYEFTCPCGQAVLVRGGDMIPVRQGEYLCEDCGKGHPLKQVGEKVHEIVCYICRKRLDEQMQGSMFPSENEEGETTNICVDCQNLDMEGEEWKAI